MAFTSRHLMAYQEKQNSSQTSDYKNIYLIALPAFPASSKRADDVLSDLMQNHVSLDILPA